MSEFHAFQRAEIESGLDNDGDIIYHREIVKDLELPKYFKTRNLFLVKMVEQKFDEIKTMTNERLESALLQKMHDRFIDDLVLATTETKVRYTQLQDIADSELRYGYNRQYSNLGGQHFEHGIKDVGDALFRKVTSHISNTLVISNYKYDKIKLGEEINDMYREYMPNIPSYSPNNLPKNREEVIKIVNATPAYWYLGGLDELDFITPVTSAQIIRAIEKLKPDQIKLMFHDIRNVFVKGVFTEKRKFSFEACNDLVRNIPESIRCYVNQYMNSDKLSKTPDISYNENNLQLQNYGVSKSNLSIEALGLTVVPADVKGQFNFNEELNMKIISWIKSGADENMVVEALQKNNFECVRIHNYIGAVENYEIYKWYFFKYDIFGTALMYGYYDIADAIIRHALQNRIILYRNSSVGGYQILQLADHKDEVVRIYGDIIDRVVCGLPFYMSSIKHLINPVEMVKVSWGINNKCEIEKHVTDGTIEKFKRELESDIKARINSIYRKNAKNVELGYDMVDGILECVTRYNFNESELKYLELKKLLMSDCNVKLKKQYTKDIVKLFKVSGFVQWNDQIDKIWMHRMEDIEHELSVSQIQHLGDNNQYVAFIAAYNLLVDVYDVYIDKYERDYEMLCEMFPKSEIKYDFRPRYAKMQPFHADQFETLYHTWLQNYKKITLELDRIRNYGKCR